MSALTREAIRSIADAKVIFQRGEDLYRYGAFPWVYFNYQLGELNQGISFISGLLKLPGF
jgi:hypothetical protein